MKFHEKYPTLYQLFAGSFYVGTEEGMDDKAILNQYVEECADEDLPNARMEMADLMQHPASWPDAAYAAWLYFSDTTALATWIQYVHTFLLATKK